MKRCLVMMGVVAVCAMARAEDLLPPMTDGVASEFAQRRAGAEVGARHRIDITQPGLYRITHADLLSAGFTNPLGSQVRLFCRTQEIALATTTEGTWAPGDYAVFYGWPHDGYHTKSNAYWLGVGGTGLRMQTRDGSALAGATTVSTHAATARFDDDVLWNPYFQPLNDEMDHWFARLLTNSGDTTVTVTLTNRVPSGNATWRFALWGVSSDVANPTDHVTRITINGVTVTNKVYDGQAFAGVTCTVSAATMPNGANTVTFRQVSSAAGDTAVLQWFDVAYTSSNKPTGGSMTFPGEEGPRNYTSGPWSTTNGLWVLDIDNPYHPVVVTGFVTAAVSGGSEIRWGDYGDFGPVYHLSSTSQFASVSISSVLFRNWGDTTRGADYVIICDPSVRPSAYRLAKHRVKSGMRALIIPIRDVYDEFSYGIKDPGAIKQLIGYTFHHWSTSPQYFVLAGDGSYDPQNRRGLVGAQDMIPVHLGPTGVEYTSLDGWYATVNGSDFLVDVGLGRFPVANDAQMSNAVEKIISFEAQPTNATWRKKALLVADQNDSTNNIFFAAASDAFVAANLVDAGFTSLNKVYMTVPPYSGNPTAMRAAITNGINGSVHSVSYFGHGFVDVWSSFFDTNDVAKLQNTVWPIFNVLTCANGDFDNPLTECLTEKLLERQNRGASATISASALSFEVAAEGFADGFYNALSTPGTKRLHDLMDAGLLNVWQVSPNSYELLFYGIFGDPAMVVRP